LGTRRAAAHVSLFGALAVLAATLLPHAQAVAAGETNLVANPGCEVNVANWTGYQGQLTRVTSGARSGNGACQVKYVSGGYYTLDDSPASVALPAQGARYFATAWVRSTTAVGKPARLILRQSGGTRASSRTVSSAVQLSDTWQQLSVSTTIDAPDRKTLEIYVDQSQAVAGNSMLLDDLSLALDSAATGTATPAATSTPSSTATPSAEATSTATTEPTATATVEPTATATAEPTSTATVEPTATATSDPAATATPTATATPSPTPSASPTPAGPSQADLLNATTLDEPLFSESSPWNVPARGAADANSDLMIGNLAAALPARGFAINTDRYGIPLFYADASTPRVAVKNTTTWWRGFEAPIPPQAKPDPGSDHHLAVWDVSSNRVYEFWNAVKGSDGRWSASYGIWFDTTGSGHQIGNWKPSARAYGGSLVAGAIRYHEMKAGRIEHALAMAYPTTRGDMYAGGVGPDGVTAIATHSDNDRSANRTTAANIPEGARLRLKSSVDVGARCAGRAAACLVIGEALKTYGAYVVDTGGAPVFYAENLQGKQVSWNGVLGALDAGAFRATDFEVLGLPPLTRAP
jgi:hypothetical protein